MQIDIQMIANASIVVTIENKVKFAMDPALAPQGTSIGFGIKSKKVSISQFMINKHMIISISGY